MELGRTYTRWFLNGDADSLVAVTDSAMLANGGGKAWLVDKINQVALRAGAQTKVLVEKMTRRKGIPQFWHEADFAELTGGPLVIRWLMGADGRIIGLGLGRKSQTPEPDQP